MHDPGPILHRDEVGVDDEEGRLVGDQVGVERLVALAEQTFRVNLRLDLVVALEHGQACPRQDVALVALPDPHIGDVESHGKGNVAG